MSELPVRAFSPEIKLRTLERLAAGEPVSSLAGGRVGGLCAAVRPERFELAA